MTVQPDSSTPRRAVGKNVMALMFSQSATWVLSAVMLAILPRFLSPTEIGELRLGPAVWMIATALATFGSATLLSVEVARQPSVAAFLTREVIHVRYFLMVVTLPIIAVLVWAGPYNRQAMLVIALTGAAAFVGVTSSAYNATLYGLQEMGETSRIDVATKFAWVATTVAVLLVGGKVVAVAAASIAAPVLSVTLLHRALHRRLPPEQDASPLVGTRLIGAGLIFLLAEATIVVYQQVDTVVMSLLVDPDAIGWYGAADVLFGSLLFIPTIVTTALFPAMASLHRQAPDEAALMLQPVLRQLLLVSFPIGIGTVIVGQQFVKLLYGSAFENSGPVLQVFGVVTILMCVTILLGSFALATGRARTWSIFMVGAICVSIGFDFVFVPWADRRYDNGAIGGALGYVVTEGLLIVVGIVVVARNLLNRHNAVRLTKCLIASAAMLLAGWPLRDRFLAIPLAASLVAYVAAILGLSTLDERERQQIRRVVDRARSRLRR